MDTTNRQNHRGAERLLRLPRVLDRLPQGRSSFYARIDQGLFTPGIPLGPRMVAWPESEVDALIAARIAGKTDDEIRTLVSNLMAARRMAA